MFGNLVNNKQLMHLIERKYIEIDGWEDSEMSLAHYALHPGRIKVRTADGRWITQHDFEETNNPFSVPPNGYVIVVIAEKIKLNNENIVGHFDPASTLIEKGFDLVSGKIDKQYGTTGEKHGSTQEQVVFGLKNLLGVSNEIEKGMNIAHVSFYDLRGIASEKVALSQAEINQRLHRLLQKMNG